MRSQSCSVLSVAHKSNEQNLISCLSVHVGRIKPDEWMPPQGFVRTLLVDMDTAQYQIDMNRMAASGGVDVYATFNLLMRRKPKENNFKAILESIRDLMNETCSVPEWLNNIFLGYGDPASASYVNMEVTDWCSRVLPVLIHICVH